MVISHSYVSHNQMVYLKQKAFFKSDDMPNLCFPRIFSAP